jgi:carbonic anhydrase
MLTVLSDCGLSHFHDDQIREALKEISPEAKDLIESTKFGEITAP